MRMVLMFLCMQEVSRIGRVWVCARNRIRWTRGGRPRYGYGERQQQQQTSAVWELRQTQNNYDFGGRRRATDG